MNQEIEEAIGTIGKYIEETSQMDDEAADDGDGRIDTWQSIEFQNAVEKTKEALEIIKNHFLNN